ncbi:hypothetical protein FKW77_004921 [Venturia effusa]|uniref:RNA helicase n=1 Tax=Venturia effusa TaxID=50376 RepID=A0A517LH41_9PEZI|nr:hypothetical protein FKW77_004921 [Venturia effusa]
MSRLPPSICLFCQARFSIRLQWQQSRSISRQSYKPRRPSRMELSPNVSKNYDDRTARGRPAYKSRNSPFGGMNLKQFPEGGIVNQRSAAEIKRSARGAKEKPRKEEGFRALKMQQTLATVGYGARSAVKEKIDAIDSFDDFPLLPGLRDSISPQALKGMEDIAPTPIQRLAIPALLGIEEGKKRRRIDLTPPKGRMREFLLAAETGSGKTLAYLLPTIDDMKRHEIVEAEKGKEEKKRIDDEKKRKKENMFELEAPPSDDSHPTTGRPRVVILVPTAELVDQVGAVAKSLSHTVKFRAAMISSAYSGVVIRNRLFNPAGIDILISTPHLLASITEADPNVLSRVSHLVIDEADSLFDRSFAPLTSDILDRATPSLKQLILCSATIPRRLDSYIRKRFPDIRRLTTPNLHAIPRRVQLGVVDVEKDPFRGSKDLACADTIWTIGKSAMEHTSDEMTGEKAPKKRILVFVNEREKTIELADYLVSKGIDAVALNRDTDVRKQVQTLGHFTAASPNSEEEAPMKRKEARKQGITKVLPNTKVLVVTDLASRGIDTTAVRHVVLYDVPHTTIDFIHRLGRTGRMGRRGRGVVLVGKNDRRDIVKEVRDGMFKGTALI